MTTFLKMYVGFPWHPRIMSLSDKAFRVHVTAMCHARAYLTDGYIHKPLTKSWGATPKIVRELEDVGVWEPAENGWLIHDWLQYNSSREEIERVSETRALAGRKGGQAKAKQPASKLPSNDQANLQARIEKSREEKRREEEIIRARDDDEAFASCIRAWEEATGNLVTPQVGDSLAHDVEEFGAKDVLTAIRLAGENNAKGYSYVHTILTNSKAQGRVVGAPKPKRGAAIDDGNVLDLSQLGALKN